MAFFMKIALTLVSVAESSRALQCMRNVPEHTEVAVTLVSILAGEEQVYRVERGMPVGTLKLQIARDLDLGGGHILTNSVWILSMTA